MDKPAWLQLFSAQTRQKLEANDLVSVLDDPKLRGMVTYGMLRRDIGMTAGNIARLSYLLQHTFPEAEDMPPPCSGTPAVFACCASKV